MINYSFIIPHKNNPELLQRCVSSIPRREDVEIIVVDDNSDIKGWKNFEFTNPHNVRLIKTYENKGGGYCRNVGITEATGRWLVFSDCDDFMSENFLHVLDRYKDEDIDVLFYNFNYVNSETLETTVNNYISNIQNIMQIPQPSKYEEDYIRYKIHTVWSKMVSRELVLKYNIKFEEIRNGNDILFSFAVGYFANNVKFISDKLYNYTYSPNTISRGKGFTSRYLYNVENSIKRNYFYEFIGHPEWKGNVLRKLLAPLKLEGFKAFLLTINAFVSNYKSIMSRKNYYVEYIKQRQTI